VGYAAVLWPPKRPKQGLRSTHNSRLGGTKCDEISGLGKNADPQRIDKSKRRPGVLSKCLLSKKPIKCLKRRQFIFLGKKTTKKGISAVLLHLLLLYIRKYNVWPNRVIFRLKINSCEKICHLQFLICISYSTKI
jgi:hypothetical protein